MFELRLVISTLIAAQHLVNAVLLDSQIETHSSAAKILQSRGYIAKDHHVRVQEGKYTLNLIQAKNPLINYADHQDKEPLLFVHGIMNNANSFVWLNEGVEPRNYSSYDLGLTGESNLRDLLKDDPASQSLVFTALNFGYEVWLLNCRSVYDTRSIQSIDNFSDIISEEHEVGDKTKFLLDKENSYWNYSLDEQALYDLPGSIGYILKHSDKKKLSIVAHSFGTSLTLMALSEIPELADKDSLVSKAILWAPVMDLEYGLMPGSMDPIFLVLLPTLSKLKAPFIQPKMMDHIQNIVYIVCSNEILRRSACERLLDSRLGKGSSQLKISQLIRNKWLETIGNFEILHFYQNVLKKKMHRYDYLNLGDNLKAYGQLKPPAYNVSKIKLKSISLWFGVSDEMSRIENFNSFFQRVTVPVKQQIVGDNENLFNHMGFQLHEKITDLLIIPSLKTLAKNH